jgi:hypothetical protein
MSDDQPRNAAGKFARPAEIEAVRALKARREADTARLFGNGYAQTQTRPPAPDTPSPGLDGGFQGGPVHAVDHQREAERAGLLEHLFPDQPGRPGYSLPLRRDS